MTQTIAHTPPENFSYEPTPIHITLSNDVPRYWNRGEFFATYYMNACSLIFPPGEKFFIDSVRAHLSFVKDERLFRDVKAFCGQEAWHRKGHEDFNSFLAGQGFPIAKIQATVQGHLDFAVRNVPVLDRLAATVGLEHITAVLAEQLLSRPEQIESIHPQIRRIWVWHACEELEHKSVAFDVYLSAGGGRVRLFREMIFITTVFLGHLTWNILRFMKSDGKLFNLNVWWQGFKFFFGRKKGILWQTFPNWQSYFRTNFHPWQNHDHLKLIHWARKWLADESITEQQKAGS